MEWFLRKASARRKTGTRRTFSYCRLAVELLENRLTPSVSVLSYHNDPASTGQNLAETALTQANVNVNSFGLQLTLPVDGQVYAQPLVMTAVNITTGSNQGIHDVVFVATENDSLYAFDAESGTLLWQDALLPSKYGGTVTAVPSADVGTDDVSPEIGITSTPVIDPATGTIYVEEKTKEVVNGTDDHYLHWLNAIDVGSGAEKLGGPVCIADSLEDTYVSGPTVNGTGDNPGNAPAGQVAFDALRQLNRTALTLVDGNIYMGFASHGDTGPYHGWVLGYRASDLTPTAAFNTTPNGTEGGIWQSGGTVASDAEGNLYVETGNGTFDTTMTGAGFPSKGDYGDSVLKLAVDPNSAPGSQNGNLNGWGLKVVDYFAPSNQEVLDKGDLDLGSGAPLLLPDSAGSAAHPHLLVASGKQGAIYLIDRNNMGHFHATSDQVVQELPQGTIAEGSYDTPAYYNGEIYYGGHDDNIKAFTIANAHLSTTPTSETPSSFGFPGTTPSISADGSINGILWGVDVGTSVLHAYNVNNLSDELYNSSQAANNADALGTAVKFSVVTVANGFVYAGTSNSLDIYGLKQPATHAPTAPSNLSASVQSGTTVALSWRDNDTAPNLASGYTIEASTDGGNTFATVGTVPPGTSSFAVTGLQVATAYVFQVVAFNGVGNSSPSQADATTLGTPDQLSFSPNFAGATDLLTLNGSGKLNANDAELTDGGQSEAGSVFTATPVNISKFSTQFTFQLSSGSSTGNGFTFTIQGAGSTALGGPGQSLGYAPIPGHKGGIGTSAAIKFDLFNSAGEGPDSTGLYTDAAQPTVPAVNLTGTGIDLHSGDVFSVQLTYDGVHLTQTITDTNTQAAFSHTYTVNLPKLIGRGVGYVGFTGGTGSATAVQNILSWTYQPTGAVLNAPANVTARASSASQVTVSWTNRAAGQTGFDIIRSTNSAFTANRVVLTASPSASSYVDAGLTARTTYHYEVRAVGATGFSSSSAAVSVTTPALPVAPTNLQATLVTTTGIDLSWINHSTAALRLQVLRQTDGGNFVLIATLSSSVNSYFDTGVAAGTQYTYELEAVDDAGASSAATLTVSTPATAPSGLSAHINFSSSAGEVAAGYLNDTGAAYGSQNSLTYGWLANGTPASNTAGARDRQSPTSPDEIHDSFIFMQESPDAHAAWQIAVPNGTYLVHILAGDPTFFNSVYIIDVNGQAVVNASPSALDRWADGTRAITVSNGLLTVTSGKGAVNNKIDAIDIVPAPAGTLVQAINAGGGAAGPFVADTNFQGGTTAFVNVPIDTSGVTNPAPQTVYQSARYGNFTYTLTGLLPSTSYTVRLDFAEVQATAAGQRTFNVAINGTGELSDFDVFKTAGGARKAVAESFTAETDSKGTFTISFTSVVGKAMVSGIEILT